MRSVLLFCLLVAALPCGAAHAEEARELPVDEAGSVPLDVPPGKMVTIQFPEPLQRVVTSDRRLTPAWTPDSAVVSLAIEAPAGTSAELLTVTARRTLTLKIRVTAGDVAGQVRLIPRSEKERFDRRVADEASRRCDDTQARLTALEAQTGADAARRAEDVLLERLLRGLAVRSLDGIARTDDNVVFRTTRAALVGEDVVVVFSIQNRNDGPYPLGAVQVGGTTARVRLGRGAVESPSTVGSIPAGATVGGVAKVPARAVVAGRKTTVRFVHARTRQALTVGGQVLLD